jgi:hypothetical protein
MLNVERSDWGTLEEKPWNMKSVTMAARRAML